MSTPESDQPQTSSATSSSNNGAAADAFKAGFAHHKQGQLDEAARYYQAALEICPTHFGALHLSGVLALQAGKFARAVALIEAAIAAEPGSPGLADAYGNLGVALNHLGQRTDALAVYDKAIALKRDEADLLYNRGNVLLALGQFEAALDSYDRAVALRPKHAEAYANRGSALRSLKRYRESAQSYAETFARGANLDFLRGVYLHSKMQICDWTDFDIARADLQLRIERGEKVSPPFAVLGLIDDPALQRRAAEIWTASQFPDAARTADKPTTEARGGRIRLGYFSMDFRNHPVAKLIAGLIALHDRRKFEVIAFSYGHGTDEPMRKQLERSFDTFIDIKGRSDADAAALARDMNIDIAIDLAGHTTDARTGIFALRAAPVQVNYLGYSGTSGAPYMDYILADGAVIPAHCRHHYTENVALLPHCYLAGDGSQAIDTRAFTRAELKLPDQGFVFCCFNNSFKILPEVFARWMRILKTVEDSVLWLKDEPTAAANLRAEAERHGVNGERLIFAPRVALTDHFARHRAADLFLDTWPYSAHTTASDSLWAGVPVLTMTGESFASRAAASLLRAVGLPEMVTSSPDAYDARAVELATNPARLNAIAQKLAVNRTAMPLFDTALHARHVEVAYTRMAERQRVGLPPAPIEIETA